MAREDRRSETCFDPISRGDAMSTITPSREHEYSEFNRLTPDSRVAKLDP